MDDSDLQNRFTHHMLDGEREERCQRIRFAMLSAARLVNGECPESREKSLAVTHLEDAAMWASAAIARRK